MALANKRNNHSESHKCIYAQATIQTRTILLLALLLQERHPLDFKATWERQKRLQEHARLKHGHGTYSSALHSSMDKKTKTR